MQYAIPYLPEKKSCNENRFFILITSYILLGEKKVKIINMDILTSSDCC